MLFSGKIKLSPELKEKVELASSALGCATVAEFVEQALERECQRILGSATTDELSPEEVARVTDKLKGLGYLD